MQEDGSDDASGSGADLVVGGIFRRMKVIGALGPQNNKYTVTDGCLFSHRVKESVDVQIIASSTSLHFPAEKKHFHDGLSPRSCRRCG